METVKDGSPARLGDQQARPEPSSLEPLPLAPISMLCSVLESVLTWSTIHVGEPGNAMYFLEGGAADTGHKALCPVSRNTARAY